MVQIIQEQPRQSFSSMLGQQLGQGLGSGISKGAEMAYKLRGEQAKKIGREREGLGKEINSFIKDYGHTDFNMPTLRKRLDEAADMLVQKGHSKRDAVRLAHEFVTEDMKASGQTLPSQEQEEPSMFQKEMADMSRTISKKDLAKVGRPFMQLADIPGHLFEMLQEGAGLQSGVGKQLQKNIEVPKATNWYDKVTGGQGIPENRGDQFRAAILSGGIPGLGAEAAMQGAEALGAPEWLQNTLGILSFVGTHRLSSVRPKGFNASNKIVSRAETIAKETGQSVEEVLANAERSSGANLARVMEGDVREAEKVSEALSASSKRVSEAPKSIFNQKAAEKERSIFGKRVAESPLEEYYDIEARAAEKASRKTAPTLAKEAEVTQRLAPVEKQLSSRANEIKDQMTRMQQAKRGVPEAGKARIDVLLAEKENQLAKVMGELEETRYQLKNFREKPTEAQTAKQIEQSLDRFRKEAKSPTPEGQAKISKDLEGDRKYLEVAAKLDKRGQLPGDFKPDTYVEMQRKYADAYREAIKAEKESLKGMKKAERASGDQFIKYLSDRVNALEAKIVQQTDKQKALRGLEKPSGAFYKQQLKETRKDLERFQKDFFKHTGRVKSIESAKAHTVAKEALGESKSVPKTEQKSLVQKETERFKEPETKQSVAKKDLDRLPSQVPPKDTPASLSDFDKWIKTITRSLKYGLPTAVIAGAIQAVVEEYSGVKPNITMLRQIMKVFSSEANTSSVPVSGDVSRFLRGLFETAEADRIKKMSVGSDERWRYMRKMEEKRGKSAARRIRQKVDELDKEA